MARGKKSKANKKSGKGGTKDGAINRTYIKIEATFKCSNTDKCGKTWSSVHAWERDEVFYCDCDGRAEIEKFLDEMCDVDSYTCNACGEHWLTIHSDQQGNGEQCDCGALVQSSGTQNRFGRHFWFVCTRENCKAEFEDFSITPQRTQRCGTCRSRGDIIKTRKVKNKPLHVLIKDNERRRMNGGGSGKHNWECCDMCVDLMAQGKGGSCLSFRKVHCAVSTTADGVTQERITGVSVK